MIGVILMAKIVMLFVISNCVAGTTIDQYGQDVPIVRPCWLSTHGWVIVNDTTPSHTEEKVEKVPSLPPPPIDDSSESLAELKHGKLDASSPTITNNSHFDFMPYIIIAVIALIAIAIVKRGGKTVPAEKQTKTKTRRYTEGGVDVEETITENNELVQINNDILELIRTTYPRDYKKILSFVAEHLDDVKEVVSSSKDARKIIDALYEKFRALRRCRRCGKEFEKTPQQLREHENNCIEGLEDLA
jgi:hypothetical protein